MPSEELEGETDFYFAYKNCEFLLNTLFLLSEDIEKCGDGVGWFILCKMLMPIFHITKHKNYCNSIFWFILRVYCTASPKEAKKLIHERFV